jgi:formate hydrogenlyase subunit 6/NADH:ubiquinone oxidoreductase subunit I
MRLRLLYRRDNVGHPVLSDIVLKTKIPINILEAKVSLNGGELVVDVPATENQLNKVRELFQEAGVSTSEIKSAIEIDYEKCVSCGACVSPCPVQAITQDSDWNVKVDEERCISCRICVDACPVKAIRSL